MYKEFVKFAVVVYGNSEQITHFEHMLNKVGPYYFVPWFTRVRTTKDFTVFCTCKKIDRYEINNFMHDGSICELLKGSGLTWTEDWFYRYYIIED